MSAPAPVRGGPGEADFSLVQGGPLFQLWRRSRLSDDALQLLHRRIIVFSAFAWLPLLVLSALEGHLLGGSVAVPFFQDVEVHARFLLVLPLLIGAERTVHRRMRHVPAQFLERELIPTAALARFEAAVASAARLRNSVPAEVVLIALVYGLGVVVVWGRYLALDAPTWYATPAEADGSRQLSLAGMWYGAVSLPMFQFLALRWYFRILIWARFLWQVSRIDLQLVPTHPDRIGGLSLLDCGTYSFLPLAFAHGALLAGQIASRIFYLDATLPDFKVEIVLLVVLMLGLALGPLLVFANQLWNARVTGKREYDTLAERYVREFDHKWLRGGASADEPLVGSADIQSLADLGNSIEVVRSMRLTVFTKESVLLLALATLAPIAPLVLTMMPLDELLAKLLGILL